MTQPELQTIAVAAAINHGLDPALVCSVCRHESSWDPYAWNPEPDYRYLWDVKLKRPFRKLTPWERSSETPPEDFHALIGDRDQEWWGQQISWGLMQVMGGVAREQGFSGRYLTQLCEPLDNVIQGCKRLRRALGKNGGVVHAALLDYNGGGNANYPDLVMGHFNDYAYLNSATRTP